MLGVGSTHCVWLGPEQRWQAASHLAHAPDSSVYWPCGQRETHLPSISSEGKTVSGQPPRFEHALGVHEVHCVARGPEHVLHRAAHGRQTRASSA